jgi:hypothetical protein
MQVVLSGQFVELWVVGVFELIPGHDDSGACVSLARNKAFVAGL